MVRSELMLVHYDNPVGSHYSAACTMQNISRHYFWHGIQRNITEHIKSCNLCQRVAVHRHREYGELELLPVPTGPFKTIIIDFITGLPAARHQNSIYDVILVVVDAYTKWALYVPCTKDIDVPELAELLFKIVFSKYGVPKRIVSDYRSLFTSTFWASLCYYIGI
jgi:hypothetical protein